MSEKNENGKAENPGHNRQVLYLNPDISFYMNSNLGRFVKVKIPIYKNYGENQIGNENDDVKNKSGGGKRLVSLTICLWVPYGNDPASDIWNQQNIQVKENSDKKDEEEKVNKKEDVHKKEENDCSFCAGIPPWKRYLYWCTTCTPGREAK